MSNRRNDSLSPDVLIGITAKHRAWHRWAVRLGLVVLGLAAWFWTQSLIGAKPFDGRIGDRILDWLGPANRYLAVHTAAADALLIASSTVINLLAAFLIARSIFGPTFRPFLGLLMLFALRQTCQGLVTLPAPDGVIWRDPGVPGLLVTYGVSNDLFFSGHTAIAVFGAVELARMGGRLGRLWVGLGILIAAFEIGTVLVLRAHWTMDVFTGTVTALWVAGVARSLAPRVDRLMA
ncbi:MAG: phosphatase PAP2-related protein [Tepidisphaerales bacterium]